PAGRGAPAPTRSTGRAAHASPRGCNRARGGGRTARATTPGGVRARATSAPVTTPRVSRPRGGKLTPTPTGCAVGPPHLAPRSPEAGFLPRPENAPWVPRCRPEQQERNDDARTTADDARQGGRAQRARGAA